MSTLLQQTNATDFLMFAYFRVSTSDNSDKILNAAMDRAYRDAASHVLSFQDDNDKTQRNTAKETAKNIILT
ncbi:MAG: hypothetical protein II192_09080, partial [Clostridia bacterium]|nr:hypothetical protein [Clostridia bacterium]